MPSLSSLLSVEDDLQNNFDKWMYILQQLPNLQIQRRDLHNPAFQTLFEASETAKFTPEEKNKLTIRILYSKPVLAPTPFYTRLLYSNSSVKNAHSSDNQ